MIGILRPVTGLFFILFVFIFSVSAQTVKKSSLSADLERESAAQNSVGAENSPVGKPKNVSTEKSSAGKVAEETQSEPEEDYKLRRGDKEVQFEFGIAPFNPSNFAGPKEFDVYGRHLYMGTVRFGRIIGTKRNVSYEYLLGVTPLAIFEKNEVVNKDYVSATATPNIAPTKRETTYGVGFQPVNFRFIFLAKNRWKPYAMVGAGIMLVNKAVPVPRSTLFQLTGEFGGGLMYMLSPKKAINFGYKYFHISNGNIGGKINNPGFNANVFYINYSFFWNRK